MRYQLWVASSATAPLKRRLFDALLTACLLLVFAGCSSNAPPQSAQATPETPTAAPKRVLYQSNWTSGLDGWKGKPGWKAEQGELHTDLSVDNDITIPYTSDVADYSIEFRLKVVNSVPGAGFSLTIDKTDGTDGLNAGVAHLQPPGYDAPKFSYPQAQVFVNPSDDQTNKFVTIDYLPGTDWHVYRIDIHSKRMVFYSDDQRLSYADCTRALSRGPIHFTSAHAILNMSYFRISTL